MDSRLGVLVYFCLSMVSSAFAEDRSSPSNHSLENQITRTIGMLGPHLDVAEQAGWRIQLDARSHQYRLVDENYRVHFKGTKEECQVELREINPRLPEELASRETVLLLHGLGRTCLALGKITKALEASGYRVVEVNYPSTRITIAEAAQGLRSVITSQQTSKPIHLVGHSLGGVICRAAACVEPVDPRVKRLVMLGSPNYGAELADKLQHVPFFDKIVGPVGDQLLTSPDSFVSQLGAPPVEFGVIAGAKGDGKGYSSTIPGDDDGTVSLKSAVLEGAADVFILQEMHAMLLYDVRSLEATSRFLKSGRFAEN